MHVKVIDPLLCQVQGKLCETCVDKSISKQFFGIVKSGVTGLFDEITEDKITGNHWLSKVVHL